MKPMDTVIIEAARVLQLAETERAVIDFVRTYIETGKLDTNAEFMRLIEIARPAIETEMRSTAKPSRIPT